MPTPKASKPEGRDEPVGNGKATIEVVGPPDGEAKYLAVSNEAALPRALNDAQLAIITGKTPSGEVKQVDKRGGRYPYVEIGYVQQVLNQAFGMDWDFEIVDKQILDEEVLVEGRLTVRTAFATIVKTNFGGAEIKRYRSTGKPLSIADDYKSAVSDCIKKCASMLGVAADVYGKERAVDMSQSQSQSLAPTRDTRDMPSPAELTNRYNAVVAEVGAWSEEGAMDALRRLWTSLVPKGVKKLENLDPDTCLRVVQEFETFVERNREAMRSS